MNLRIFDKKTAILIVVLIFGVIILGGVVLFRQTGKPEPANNIPIASIEPTTPFSNQNPPIHSNPASDIKIVSISPADNSFLSLNQKPVIIVSFEKGVSLNEVRLKLTKLQITKSDPEVPVDFNPSLNDDGKILTLNINSVVTPYTHYTLDISDTKGNLVYRATYSSEEITASPEPNNNLELKNYLPLDASNYKLSFDNQRKIYIFNFKQNLNDPKDLNVQFEDAKKDADDFIKSKGIDPATVSIEYKHY